MADSSEFLHKVNFSSSRTFGSALKSSFKETFFPDDPFRQFKNQTPLRRTVHALKYFVPVLDWAPKYKFKLFRYDLLSGITIASLAIPQGISYAKLANLPPIIGLYSSFVPPLIYAVFGSSKDLAVGTVAAASLLMASIIGSEVSVVKNPTLYLHLFFTAAFFTGVFQTALGFLRLGILVDFLSRSTILGFMGGTATIICLQQLKGMFGLQHFTTNMDVISVMHSIFTQTHKSKKKPRLFWVSAISPLLTVILGCLLVYFARAEKHGIQIVGPLKKGLSPPSIKYLNFEPRYLKVTVKAGIISGILALTEGIAIGRSFAMMKNYQIDGNKEMVAFGLMNIAGAFTSCYLTTGPFSKSAVNYNAGCKTQMSNVVMSICLMLTLLFLAPLFSYTPLVALSAIIISAMIGLIEYEEAYHLFKVDKFDFLICMAAFLGVVFVSMDVGLMVSVGISIVRSLLYLARPGISKLVNIPNTKMYRDVEQYPSTNDVPGILILELGSPIYFSSAGYLRERILRWIDEEHEKITNSGGNELQYVILDMGGVTSIDKPGIEMLHEVQKNIHRKGIKMALTNPRIEVMEKFLSSNFLETFGKEWVFLSVAEAVTACRFMLHESKQKGFAGLNDHTIAVDNA
ncbi:sulfate transporter 3.1-like isoform X2 [Magnolia sinica]|uniref:sulfate transporter 3.1-like isoform X2 n=1 Tax=Magnolia sinica TaxID=86752 RepID=UPI00265A54DB|nr:sulfate transporter 3.1-like isoform X2 [Magnolia sinica]